MTPSTEVASSSQYKFAASSSTLVAPDVNKTAPKSPAPVGVNGHVVDGPSSPVQKDEDGFIVVHHSRGRCGSGNLGEFRGGDRGRGGYRGSRGGEMGGKFIA